MTFSATWEVLGENTIVIKGDNANDVDLLTRWFERYNTVERKEELDGQIIMTILGEIFSPKDHNPQFGYAAWGLVNEGTTVVIQGKNEDHVHSLAEWFRVHNTVRDGDVDFEICIRFRHFPIETPLTNKWDSDDEPDEGEEEGEDDEGDEVYLEGLDQ
jgi:hypothetical protein